MEGMLHNCTEGQFAKKCQAVRSGYPIRQRVRSSLAPPPEVDDRGTLGAF